MAGRAPVSVRGLIRPISTAEPLQWCRNSSRPAAGRQCRNSSSAGAGSAIRAPWQRDTRGYRFNANCSRVHRCNLEEGVLDMCTRRVLHIENRRRNRGGLASKRTLSMIQLAPWLAMYNPMSTYRREPSRTAPTVSKSGSRSDSASRRRGGGGAALKGSFPALDCCANTLAKYLQSATI